MSGLAAPSLSPITPSAKLGESGAKHTKAQCILPTLGPLCVPAMAPEIGGDLFPSFPPPVLYLEALDLLGTQKILGSDNQTSMLQQEKGRGLPLYQSPEGK